MVKILFPITFYGELSIPYFIVLPDNRCLADQPIAGLEPLTYKEENRLFMGFYDKPYTEYDWKFLEANWDKLYSLSQEDFKRTKEEQNPMATRWWNARARYGYEGLARVDNDTWEVIFD